MGMSSSWRRRTDQYTSDYDAEAIMLERQNQVWRIQEALKASEYGAEEFLPSFEIRCKDCGGTEFAIYSGGCGGESGGDWSKELVCCQCGNTGVIDERSW